MSFGVSSKNLCLAKAKIGWCHKYALYEIRPTPTIGDNPKNLFIKVLGTAVKIKIPVPKVGISAYKLGNGVDSLK